MELQGTVIPHLYGHGSFNGLPARILSYVDGGTLQDHARSKTNIQEKALETRLTQTLMKLYDHGAEHWDRKLDNFLFCDHGDFDSSKVMIVDFEGIQFPGETEPWETNVNLGGVGALMSEFRYVRNPNREPSPVRLWMTKNHGENAFYAVGLRGPTQLINRGNTEELNSIIPSGVYE